MAENPRLRVVPDAPSGLPLSIGATGPIIKTLQENLRRWGFDPGHTSGIYDHSTAEAMSALQRKLGSPITGQMDEQTLVSMRADLGSVNSVLKENEKTFTITAPADDPLATNLVPVKPPWKPWIWIGGALAIWALTKAVKVGPTTYLAADDGVEDDHEAFDEDDPDFEFEPTPAQLASATVEAKPKKKKRKKKKAKKAEDVVDLTKQAIGEIGEIEVPVAKET
ncbi:MAG: peptidoglycan-binding domain-containing protein [Dehalococcoidia bacterium]|nr:peptidoglycan-binding domain-containing protein [Dehalococcoidia bacterium]